MVIGQGTRLFPDTGPDVALDLVESRSAPKGMTIAEFVRTYARPDGWRGAEGLYLSMLSEGEEIKALANSRPLPMPALAIPSPCPASTA